LKTIHLVCVNSPRCSIYQNLLSATVHKHTHECMHAITHTHMHACIHARTHTQGQTPVAYRAFLCQNKVTKTRKQTTRRALN